MIGQIFPLFREGCVLRARMLEAFTDYSFRFGELLYTGYANGIISGCRLTTTGDTIIVHPGLVLFYGKVFYIKEPAPVRYAPTNELRILKLRYMGEERTESMISYELELFLDTDPAQKEGEIELCRFTLQEGAYLRCQYQDFEDWATEYDTLSMVQARYASPGHGTLHPELTRAFARELLACEPENPVDVSFCLEILSRGEPVRMEALAAYIRLRSGAPVKEENAEIYGGLSDILRKAREGAGGSRKAPEKRRRSILVE
ncbi:MAG: hypothetical protein NC337_07635 [Roseburia sp.]|nr:hypothetical protein [Roseburia sp.]